MNFTSQSYMRVALRKEDVNLKTRFNEKTAEVANHKRADDDRIGPRSLARRH